MAVAETEECLSDARWRTGDCADAETVPVMQRARGRADVAFALRDGRTRLARLFQEGQAKIRLPKVHGDEPVTAVLINTAGGVTGGDLIRYGAEWADGVTATVTSQAAERIYRSDGTSGRIVAGLKIGAAARAEWLPQETILFEGSRLDRRLEVELAGDARLLMVETVLLGRSAMGETVRNAGLSDHWRVRREGRLVFAESVRLTGDAVGVMAGRATGGGAVAYATVLYAGDDAAERLDRTRGLIEASLSAGGVEGGASAFDGLLVMRFLSRSAQALRRDLVTLLESFRGRTLPRVWSC